MKPVLVDTSVWIRSLAGKQPYHDEVDQLLVSRRVLGHELVYGELLIGDKGARAKALSTYAKLRYAQTVAHREAVNFVRARKLHGIGIGWIDVHLLAAALDSDALLYTADASHADAATRLGIFFGGSNNS